MEQNKKSPQILNTSATLFGLCFVVLTYIKAMRLNGGTLIDEFTGASMFLFMSACLLSFLSMRSGERSAWYETVADYAFLSGLFILFVITVFLSFDLVK